MWVNAELNASEAFVAVWLPGSEGSAIADVIFSNVNGEIQYDFTGKLSYSWPKSANQAVVNRFDNDYQPLIPYGFGLSYGEKNRLADNLDTQSINTPDSLQTITLFESSIKAPWKMVISDSNSSTAMTSSVVENDALYLRTIDRNVQEDARRVIFKGEGKGKVAFTSSHTVDFSQYKSAHSTLVLTVRLKETKDAIEKGSLAISMDCGEQCNGQVDISEELRLLAPNLWHTLHIDLHCFEKNGADLNKIDSPFVLSSIAPLTIDFADVFIKPNSMEIATKSCR